MRVQIQQVDDLHEAHVYSESMDDLKAVADHCRAIERSGFVADKEMIPLMTVPRILVQQYMHERGISYPEFIRNPEHATRMMNDPALSAFRLHRGRV